MTFKISMTFITEMKKSTLKRSYGNISMVLAKNIHEDQWNTIEVPDINPDSYSHLNFDKDAQNT
jgi:hypothetical protein